MTRWLVCVPEGDEVKYVRAPMSGDRLLVCDLDALAKIADQPFPLSPLFGLPIYDVEIPS